MRGVSTSFFGATGVTNLLIHLHFTIFGPVSPFGMTELSSRSPKSAKQVHWWRVSRMSGARTLYVGEFEAADTEQAIEKAADKVEVEPAHCNCSSRDRANLRFG